MFAFIKCLGAILCFFLTTSCFFCFYFCRGIFFVTKGTFGQLTCEWQYLFEEFTKDPMIVENRRLRIEAKVQIARKIKQKLDVFTGGEYFQ